MSDARPPTTRPPTIAPAPVARRCLATVALLHTSHAYADYLRARAIAENLLAGKGFPPFVTEGPTSQQAALSLPAGVTHWLFGPERRHDVAMQLLTGRYGRRVRDLVARSLAVAAWNRWLAGCSAAFIPHIYAVTHVQVAICRLCLTLLLDVVASPAGGVGCNWPWLDGGGTLLPIDPTGGDAPWWRHGS
jgi:hypothetical protein